MAGSVGGVGNNGVGISGVSWRVALWICKAAARDAAGNLVLTGSGILDCYSLCQQVGRCGEGVRWVGGWVGVVGVVGAGEGGRGKGAPM